MTKILHLLIVDDQPRARQSVKALLATRFKSMITCEAANGMDAIHRVESCKPDVVLMDARMPDMDGIEATRIIKTKYAHIPIIMLSMYPEYQAAALTAGVDAFIKKGEAPERLLEALIAALDSTSE